MRRMKERSAAAATAIRKVSIGKAARAKSALPKKGARRRTIEKMDPGEAVVRLACLYESSPFGIIEWSHPNRRVVRWSEGATSLFGWTEDEAIGKTADELRLVRPEDRQQTRAGWAGSTRSKRPHRVSKQQNLRRDGGVVVCEWYDYAISKKNKASSFMSLVLDVTERDRAKQALQASEARLAGVIESIPHGFTTIDREWRYIDVSEQAARAMHKPKDEILGRSLWELFPDTDDEFRAKCEQAWKDQTPVSFEHHSTALGRWFETFLYPFAGGLTIQGHDITDRKRAEQALRESEEGLRAVLENSPEGYAIYDADRRFEYINASHLKFANCKLEDVVGKREEELWPDEFTRGYLPHLIRTYETGLPQKVELDTTAVNGDVFTKLITFVPIKDPTGKVQRVIAVTYDLTERKRFERTLLDVDRRKNEFLAMLSHELRNPLTPIRYSLIVLDQTPPASPEAIQAKSIIERQVDHLARIVEDLLDVTRISRGKVKLKRSFFDLGALVRRTVEDNASLFGANGITLEGRVTKKKLILHGDPARIAQVLGNLLQNAAKFTPRGGRVSVGLKANAAESTAVVTVRDTGIGISAEALTRIFQPFEQAGETCDLASSGLGLGLSLVKALVEMHGGEVEAHSAGLGKGAEFVVSLPLHADASAAVQASRPSPDAPARRVLIIEDNLDSATALREVLRMGKHEVEIATSGSEGLEKARLFKPDVVFCDIGLPGMDGYHVAQAFRADRELRSAYLVALTGYALPEDRAKARAAGFDRHLAKPPGVAKLRQVIADAPVRG
jgi:PAS domain S-box-containing protein